MALGDYTKTTYINGGAPGISAERLNNNETKTEELDAAQAAHLADIATEAELGHVQIGTGLSVADGVVSHPTTAGNKHIPSGGSNGQIVGYGGAPGVGAWVDQPETANNGNWSDTTTVLSTNSTYTKSIPLGLIGKQGWLILKGCDAGFIYTEIRFSDSLTGAISLVHPTTGTSPMAIYKADSPTNLAGNASDFKSAGSGNILIDNVYIDGTDLKIIFKNTNVDYTATLGVNKCYWEVVG